VASTHCGRRTSVGPELSIGSGGSRPWEVTISDDAARPRHWLVPVLGLLIVTFCICTSELSVAGLLPTLASDLGVDIPTAGLLISGYAIGVAFAGPALSLLTSRISRRTVLLGVMGVFIVGNVLCAMAPDYWMLLGARLVVSGCHGLFFGVAMVVAVRIAPPDRQATAVSMIFAGVTAALIAGVPLGTAIGNAFGWRTTYWAVSGAGVLAAGLVAVLIPKTLASDGGPPADFRAELRAAFRPIVVLGYGIFGVAVLSFFAMQSYVVPFLLSGGIALELVPVVLFAAGIASFLGTLAGGRLGDWNPALTMVGTMAGNVALSLLLAQFAGNGWVASGILCAGMFVGFAGPGALQSRILREAGDAPNLASTLMNTASQIGIACGAALGGLVIAWGWGYGGLPILAAVFQSLALAGMLVLVMSDRRQSAAAVQ
jgi:MFS transporter, DHA1 family, inner membrane transport protein